ncbi:MAG: adenine deaminase [Ruminococcus sp.]|nr:adenine deaminase [Ruminococcus sp.]
MKRLLKNGLVVNVFTGEIEKKNVLIEDERIIGTGDYSESDTDITEDLTGKYICPGFIDGHIHIESTMLLPEELARVCAAHGTTAIVADPHEIANVCGTKGLDFMLAASRHLPLTVYMTLPSCVPSTPFDEAGAVLDAEVLRPYYQNSRVLGLGEMMNYPGVLAGDAEVFRKIQDACSAGKPVNGHAPLLSGKDLDRYIAAGIQDDHECSSAEEAMERIRKGQWVMIREGTAARNLTDLLPLFDPPFSHRCLLVTDDRHPADLLREGHIDNIIRKAVSAGKSAVTAIQMATIQAARCFGIHGVGAIAPGYAADLVVLDDLDSVQIHSVYHNGRKTAEKGSVLPFESPDVAEDLRNDVFSSFSLPELSSDCFRITPQGETCRVIRIVPGQLLTNEWITEINWASRNGVDLDRDILKLAVIERHHNTGHIGLGLISGIGMKSGAIASSVSHDSHNLIVIGTNEEDMAEAANRICTMGGGNVVVRDGEILAEMPLPVAGLMSHFSAEEVAAQNEAVRSAVYQLDVPDGIEPFMNMAFVSLPVIPSLKMTTHGLVDVTKQELVSLYL